MESSEEKATSASQPLEATKAQVPASSKSTQVSNTPAKTSEPTQSQSQSQSQAPSSPSKPPTIIVHSASKPPAAGHVRQRPSTSQVHGNANQMLKLTTPIPTGSLDDLLSPEHIKFSKRGSLIMDGNSSWRQGGSSSKRNSQVKPTNGARVLSSDEATLSAKVRSLYEHFGDESVIDQALVEEDETEATAEPEIVEDKPAPHNSSATNLRLKQSQSRASHKSETGPTRKPHEAAGGIEDFEDVKGDEIDRYGFIVARPTGSRGSHMSGATSESTMNVQRVTTSLLEASNTPRKRASVLRRSGAPSRQASKRSLKPQASVYSQTRKSVSASQSSLGSYYSSKDKKVVVDAGDMLTLPPRLAEFSGSDHAPVTKAMREKEWEREGKWKKMGRLKPPTGKGGGMQFTFDPNDPKVVSRTWKGIPDRWRAMAWYSFLQASAQKSKVSQTEDELFEIFEDLQSENSADDVQIDCDVPRTINRHIMFRKRYKGGQRLLFRVLHALSLYFPEIGYVQGMAALAATLLCYYDEEHAFVMMVRLWQLRGLEKLYQSGFEGLMDALSDFEKNWLANSAVCKKLEDVGIHSTAYGTRWYLTLFNYSIPFPAQLRVWDVFMLLGDSNDLDILHATSTALIDAMRDIIMASEFENSMKVLTSWIPIRDEELLMKVVKTEYKVRKKRAVKV